MTWKNNIDNGRSPVCCSLSPSLRHSSQSWQVQTRPALQHWRRPRRLPHPHLLAALRRPRPHRHRPLSHLPPNVTASTSCIIGIDYYLAIVNKTCSKWYCTSFIFTHCGKIRVALIGECCYKVRRSENPYPLIAEKKIWMPTEWMVIRRIKWKDFCELIK